MTLKVPERSQHARIVRLLVGPVQRLQLRHAPSDWTLYSEGKGPDVAASVEAFRRRAIRQGSVVDVGFAVKDWRPFTNSMMRSL